MFNPNSLKTLRTMSAGSQKTVQNKQLLDEINQAIEDIREWKKTENFELKKQLIENQQANKIVYKSGYEIDDDEEDNRQEDLMKQEAELNRKLQRIRQEYMKEYLHIPKYMSSEQKTQEVSQKLQQSSQRLENMENYPQNNCDLKVVDEDLLNKLTEWKSMLEELDQIDQSKEKEQKVQTEEPNEQKMKDLKQKIRQEMNIYQQEEQVISEQQKQSQQFNQNIKQELSDLDKDFDEIDSLLNQCGIK